VGKLRILLVGEGTHELGSYRDEYAEQDDLPALAGLVRRLLGHHPSPRFFCRAAKDIRNIHRGKLGSRLSKKVYSAIWYARHGKHAPLDAVVLVIDRDGPRQAGRLAEMRQGRDKYGPNVVPCALGLAIEQFDAWMIADPDAVRVAGGKPAEADQAPESIRDPKAAADRVFGTQHGTGLGPRYAIVASNADLDALEEACPEGFRPFADEVRERIRPVAGSN
jgi:hypothetical protein